MEKVVAKGGDAVFAFSMILIGNIGRLGSDIGRITREGSVMWKSAHPIGILWRVRVRGVEGKGRAFFSVMYPLSSTTDRKHNWVGANYSELNGHGIEIIERITSLFHPSEFFGVPSKKRRTRSIL